MRTITITVSVDGNEVSRNYAIDTTVDMSNEIASMLNTIEESSKPYPRTPDGYKQVDDNTFIK